MKNIKFFLVLLLVSTGAAAQPFAIFTGEKDGNADLYRIDLKNFKIEALTQSPSNEFQAAVSPDGRQVAFVSDKDGAHSLYLMDLASPSAEWKNISLGIGAHANPAFSPDGKKIVVSYSPDPERIFSNSRLVSLELDSKKQNVLLDSTKWTSAGEGQAFLFLDRPLWIDSENIVFVAIEYGDLESMRITSSGIFRMNVADPKPIHLCGGESYFDEDGNPKGYKASFVKKVGNFLTYVAVQGHTDRTPMWMDFDGKEKKVLPIHDPDFFGPVFLLDKDFLYGVQDQESNLKLAYTKDGEKEKKLIPFPGNAYEPILIP